MFTDKISRSESSSSGTTCRFFPADTMPQQEAGNDNPCNAWNKDTQSLATTVINKYITEELQWSGVSVTSFKKCDTWHPDNKHWGCDFFLSNKREGSVLILDKKNRVKVQLANDGKDGSIWCFYNYTCNEKNEISFTKDDCGSSR